MKRNGIAILLALMVLYSCERNNNFDADIAEVAACEIAMDRAERMNFAPPSVNEEEELKPTKNKAESNVKGNHVSVIEKKIIKDGDVSVETEDVIACKKSIDDKLKELNAYYEVEALQNKPERISYNLRIRVPAANFEKLISDVESGKGEIRHKNIKARDVTEEYVDIETRLANKKEYLKRYKELLSKAQKVEDVLLVEENIRNLQEEIESKEGRLKYLNDQVEFSTLELYIFKEKEIAIEPVKEEKFAKKVKDSLGYGWTAFVNFVLRIISGWPVAILILSICYLIKRIIKKRKNKRTTNE
ncbi:MAG TPA: DUF4349 domain-containing protein [Bacteroidia bacterium]|nr:DUF4349 domain-containing protein [Bacteroidia bacterium]